jgi:predicted permease
MGKALGPVSRMVDGLGREIRQAVRSLVRARGFTLVAGLSLAVGVGANAVLFALIDATFFGTIPGIRGADRIVELLLKTRGDTWAEWAYPDFRDVQAAETPLAAVAGWKVAAGNLNDEQSGQPVRVMYASSQYFPVLGVSVTRGRWFLPAEDTGPGEHAVAVVSHRLWQNTLGGREDIVGQAITLNRTPYTVIGVAPEEFRHHRIDRAVDLWAPLTQHPIVAGGDRWAEDRGALWVGVIGQLRPGATLGQANAALGTLFAQLAERHPESNRDRTALAASLGPFPARSRTEATVAVGALLAFGLLVQLIICANLAGLLLARGAVREREAAIRAALGAGRGRLARHHLVEAGALAVAGGGLGIACAWQVTALPALPSFLGMPGIDLAPGVDVAVFSLLIVIVTALAVGLVPALRLSRPEITGSLKDDVGTGGRRATRFHRIAVAAQVGVALLFVAVSGIFVAALWRMDNRDLGFDPQHLLVVHLDLSTQGYGEPAAGLPFVDRLEEAAAATPGVAAVAVADGLPIDLTGNFSRVSRVEDPEDSAQGAQVEFTRVGPGFFATIGTPLLLGRAVDRSDTLNSERVVVVSRDLADRLWRGEAAVGRQLRIGLRREGAVPHTVIGVVAEVASSRPTERWPQVFLPLSQNFDRPRLMLLVRGHSDPAALTHAIQSAILTVDPRFVLPSAETSTALIARSLEPQRTTALAAGGLGLLAIFLSAFGVYGLVAFVVGQRTREFGLRMALGARRGQIVRTVLREGLRLALPGLGIGVLAAAGVTFAMQSMLLGAAPLSPLSFGAAVLLILAVVLLACTVPAVRAARVTPTAALRAQ